MYERPAAIGCGAFFAVRTSLVRFLSVCAGARIAGRIPALCRCILRRPRLTVK